MATPLTKTGSADWAFGLNNGSELTSPFSGITEVKEASSSSEYTTKPEYIGSDGSLKDKLLTGQINKGTISGYGSLGSSSPVTFANLRSSHFSDIGGLGGLTATAIRGSNSNEDLSMISIEGIGAPDITVS